VKISEPGPFRSLQETDRRWVLLSHANPEDNQATIWFATQLANEGYSVWSDAIGLIGGEDFWGDIEEVIRYRAAKVVYLLSRASNDKDGCLKELHLAQSVARKEALKDFVIPLRIDDLSHADVNIRVSSLNSIESRAWNVGLADLLRKLDDDAVQRGSAKDFRATSEWWKSRFATSLSVHEEPENLYSNWFRILNNELVLYWHGLRRAEIGPIGLPQHLPWPALESSGGIWTLATVDSVAACLQKPYYIDRTYNFLKRRGLMEHELSQDKHCFGSPIGLVKGDDIAFASSGGRKGRRSVVGYKTRMNAHGETWLRYWHYAIQPIPAFRPEFIMMIRSHVLFSSDGKTLWSSPERLHKARRNQCKNWWNDAWRDRMLAVMSWLADGNATISIDIGASGPLVIDRHPMSFESPVSYVLPQRKESEDADTEDATDVERNDEGDDDGYGDADDEHDDEEDDAGADEK